jgi:hypothetical protein
VCVECECECDKEWVRLYWEKLCELGVSEKEYFSEYECVSEGVSVSVCEWSVWCVEKEESEKVKVRKIWRDIITLFCVNNKINDFFK